MKSQSFFYFPHFHKNFLRKKTPVPVLFFADALTPTTNKVVNETIQQVIDALPLPTKDIRAMVQEMLQIGTVQGKNLVGYTAIAQVDDARKKTIGKDISSIRSFVKKNLEPHSLPFLNKKDSTPNNPLVEAQKLLFLINFLEENTLEIQSIAQRYTIADKKLVASLKDSSHNAQKKEQLTQKGMLDTLTQTANTSFCSWKTVLKAVLPFLPKNASLYTDDTQIITFLKNLPTSVQSFPCMEGMITISISEAVLSQTLKFSSQLSQKPVSICFIPPADWLAE